MSQVKYNTWPSFTRVDGRESHDILESVKFLSFIELKVNFRAESALIFPDTEILLLLEILDDFMGIL